MKELDVYGKHTCSRWCLCHVQIFHRSSLRLYSGIFSDLVGQHGAAAQKRGVIVCDDLRPCLWMTDVSGALLPNISGVLGGGGIELVTFSSAGRRASNRPTEAGT